MARPTPRKNRPDKTQLAFWGPEAAECHQPLEPNVLPAPIGFAALGLGRVVLEGGRELPTIPFWGSMIVSQ